jgi:lincosamide nucleotidyltransferase A/C/D/E
MMNAGDVIEVLDALERSGVRVWLDGGWGIDALLEAQTRDHADLDVVLSSTDVHELRTALRAIGFEPRAGGSETSFVLEDGRGREVDVHAVEFDRRGFGEFKLADGRRWPFPPQAFLGRGRIGSKQVRCLSPDAQVQCHAQGYEPTDRDLGDMQRLQEHFGVVLPIGLCPRRLLM